MVKCWWFPTAISVQIYCCSGLKGGGRFVWVSDIHLDLLYDSDRGQHRYCRDGNLTWDDFKSIWHDNDLILPREIMQLGAHHPRRIPTTAAIAQDAPLLPAYHGRYGCDSPISLVWSLFSSIRSMVRKPNFFLLTGDIAGHYWLANHAEFRMLALHSLTWMARKAFFLESSPFVGDDPKASDYIDQIAFLASLNALPSSAAPLPPFADHHPQFIFCIGNNDLPADYYPIENSDWNTNLAKMWADIVPHDQLSVRLL